MKFWLHIHNTEPEEGLELAHMAEQLGFEGVLSDDHWYLPTQKDPKDEHLGAAMPMNTIFPDITAFGATVLATTKTLKYGSCVMILANRTNPFLVAKACSTLARLSNDRFILGVGIGWMKLEYDVAGVEWSTRAQRTEEMIEVLRKLWKPTPEDHHGKFFNFPATYALPTPKKPIPIYMGSFVPAALKRTGRIADGWMGRGAPLPEIARQMALVNEGRREAGREKEPFDFFVALPRREDGLMPTLDDYRRAEDIGLTTSKIGPIDHFLGKVGTTFDEKRRFVEDFAKRILR